MIYRPAWPYCPRCGVHVADKTDADGEIVCRFCRGHAHELNDDSTVCSICALPEIAAELRSREEFTVQAVSDPDDDDWLVP